MSRWLQANHKRKAIEVGHDINKVWTDQLKTNDHYDPIVNERKVDILEMQQNQIKSIISKHYSKEYNELEEYIKNNNEDVKQKFNDLASEISKNKELLAYTIVNGDKTFNIITTALTLLETKVSAQQENQKILSQLLEEVKQKADSAKEEAQENRNILTVLLAMLGLLSLLLGAKYKVDKDMKNFKDNVNKEKQQYTDQKAQERKKYFEDMDVEERAVYLIDNWKTLTSQDKRTLLDLCVNNFYSAKILLENGVISEHKNREWYDIYLDWIMNNEKGISECAWLIEDNIIKETNSDFDAIFDRAISNPDYAFLIMKAYAANKISISDQNNINKAWEQAKKSKFYEDFLNNK